MKLKQNLALDIFQYQRKGEKKFPPLLKNREGEGDPSTVFKDPEDYQGKSYSLVPCLPEVCKITMAEQYQH